MQDMHPGTLDAVIQPAKVGGLKTGSWNDVPDQKCWKTARVPSGEQCGEHDVLIAAGRE